MATSKQSLVSRAEFAKRAGVSRMAITKACNSGALQKACVADRIDSNHKAARAYLAAKVKSGKAPTAPEPTVVVPRHVPDTIDPDSDDIEAYADMTLRELIDTFGTGRNFRDWLDALKKIEDIRKTRLDNDETEGTLISRELVQTHVFGAIENGNRRLLMDFPKNAARRLYAAAKSGTPIEDGERLLRELIGSQLKPVKTQAAKTLRGG